MEFERNGISGKSSEMDREVFTISDTVSLIHQIYGFLIVIKMIVNLATKFVKTIKELTYQQNPPYPQCQGYTRHGICVYGIGDLEWLLEQSHLFGNKFDDNTDGVSN